MVKIDRSQVMTSTPYSSPGKNHKTVIVFHETANTSPGADARAHHRLQWNGNTRPASWHYQVDDKEAIQSFSEDLRLWHAGPVAIPFTISVEMCVNSDGDYNKMIQNAIELGRDIANRNSISSNDIVTHYFYTGKNCPTKLLSGRYGWTYDQFVDAIEQKVTKNDNAVAIKPKQPKPTKNTDEQLADEVMAGKHGSGAERMRSLGKRYEAVQKIVNRRILGNDAVKPAPKRKTDKQLADEVMAGLHGSGDARKKSLGSRYDAVQKIINKRYDQKSKPKRKTDKQLADEVEKGLHGNGEERKKSLGSRYDAVQKIINKRYS